MNYSRQKLSRGMFSCGLGLHLLSCMMPTFWSCEYRHLPQASKQCHYVPIACGQTSVVVGSPVRIRLFPLTIAHWSSCMTMVQEQESQPRTTLATQPQP